MKSLQRMSIFRRADNVNGYVQAVISSEDAEYFYLLGFGPSVNAMPELEIKSPEPDNNLPEPTAEPTEDAESAKGKRGRGGKNSADAGDSKE